jgi:hypothetical protein
MSDWWLLIAAFWFWYFADCLKTGRRARFVLSRAFGRGDVEVHHGPVALTSLSPTSWHVRTEDPPIAFSPEGLTNIPVGSAGRPTPAPSQGQVWRWEEIRELAQKHGRIFINGQEFCPVTPFTTLAEMRALIDGCKSGTPEARAVWLAGRVAGWFRPTHLRRQRTVLLGRTKTLVIWASFGWLLSVLISAYVLGGSLLPLSEAWSDWLGRIIPLVLLYLLGVHLCVVVLGWRVHRRLLRKRGEQRFSLLFSALLLPPQAYRLRSRIGAEFFQQAHPLAWLAVVADGTDFSDYARQAVADLRWPLAAGRCERPELAAAIGSWMRDCVGGEVGRLLKLRGVEEADLLKAPKRDSAESCLYCPRCQSQFTSREGRCPHGIALRPLA